MDKIIIGLVIGFILSFALFPRNNFKDDYESSVLEADRLQSCLYDYQDLLGEINYSAMESRSSIENYELEDAYSYALNTENLSSSWSCY